MGNGEINGNMNTTDGEKWKLFKVFVIYDTVTHRDLGA